MIARLRVDPFTVTEPQIALIGGSYLVRKRRWTDLQALEM